MTDLMNATSTLSNSAYESSGIADQYAFPVAVLILAAVAIWLIYTAIKNNP
jgi:hypothetical protein